MSVKYCKYCKTEFAIDDLSHWRKQFREGKYSISCKKRNYELNKKWVSDNLEARRKSNNDCYAHNIEKRREKNLLAAKKYKDKISKRHLGRKNNDVQYKLRKIFSKELNCLLRRNKSIVFLGCGISEYKKYLENNFKHGMCWDNYGRGKGKWSIDHIKPLSKFDLTDNKQKLKALHYTNTQPLWFNENCIKGNK